jgi:hypothetical protein
MEYGIVTAVFRSGRTPRNQKLLFNCQSYASNYTNYRSLFVIDTTNFILLNEIKG